jgi:hypothetical protein
MVVKTIVSRSGSGYGSGRRITLLTTLKMAVVAPMPRPSVSTAMIAKPGRRAIARSA